MAKKTYSMSPDDVNKEDDGYDRNITTIENWPEADPSQYVQSPEAEERYAEMCRQALEQTNALVQGLPPIPAPPGMGPGMPPVMPGMMPGMPYPGMPFPGMMPGMWPGTPIMPPMAGMGYGGFDPSSAPAAEVGATGTETTVMWKNLPNNYTRDGLLQLIDNKGFKGEYDFFYSPVDFTSKALVGYAFVNFVSHEAANKFFGVFENFKKWELKSEKTSKVTWSHPLQGLSGHIDRYRNSPVMHPDVEESMRPLLFKDGQKIPFPEPTKKLKPPHPKDCRPKQ